MTDRDRTGAGPRARDAGPDPASGVGGPGFDLARPLRPLVGGMFLAIVVLTIAQVLMRLADAPLIWSEELVRLLMVWVGFLGAAVVTWDGTHLGVDVLVARLSPRARTLLRILNRLLALAFTGVVFWYSLDLVAIGAMTELSAISIGGVALTERWLYLPATAGCGLMFLFIVARWLRWGRPPSDPTSDEGLT